MPRAKPAIQRPALRPKRDIDWDEVERCLMAGCKSTETAAYLGISVDTLYNRCITDNGVTYSAYSQEKRSKGDRLLYAKQYEVAVKDKNTTMLIWLGKQRLGQKEKSAEEAFSLNDLKQFLSQIAQGVSSSTESCKPSLEAQQPLLYQDSSRQESSIPNELGAERAL